jgi:hypothetical protein
MIWLKIQALVFCISYWLFRKYICKPENLLEEFFAILICLCPITFLQVAFLKGASINGEDDEARI